MQYGLYVRLLMQRTRCATVEDSADAAIRWCDNCVETHVEMRLLLSVVNRAKLSLAYWGLSEPLHLGNIDQILVRTNGFHS